MEFLIIDSELSRVVDGSPVSVVVDYAPSPWFGTMQRVLTLDGVTSCARCLEPLEASAYGVEVPNAYSVIFAVCDECREALGSLGFGSVQSRAGLFLAVHCETANSLFLFWLFRASWSPRPTYGALDRVEECAQVTSHDNGGYFSLACPACRAAYRAVTGYDHEGTACECEGCLESQASDAGIESYGYKPTPRFRGSGSVFYGFELETESETRAVETARAVQSSEIADMFYCKEDGSLDCSGVEIVSHPASLAWWRDRADALGDMLESVAISGARAWDRPHCGLHVHVSRAGFGSSSHLARFVWLMNRNEIDVRRVARRSSSYAQFCAGGFTLKAKGWGGHFDAVNTTNADTVEVRVFRPSLRVGRVLASIELVDAMRIYTEGLTAHDVALGALDWGAFESYVSESGAWPLASRLLAGGRFDTVGVR